MYSCLYLRHYLLDEKNSEKNNLVEHSKKIVGKVPQYNASTSDKAWTRAGPEKKIDGPGPGLKKLGPARKFIPHFASDWLNFYKKSRKNF